MIEYESASTVPLQQRRSSSRRAKSGSCGARDGRRNHPNQARLCLMIFRSMEEVKKHYYPKSPKVIVLTPKEIGEALAKEHLEIIRKKIAQYKKRKQKQKRVPIHLWLTNTLRMLI